MTPEAYIAAVKACPRVAWFHYSHYQRGKFLWRGYATRLDGDKVEVVPDYCLESKSTARSWAGSSTPDKLWAQGSNGNPLFLKDVLFGEIPAEARLHDYYVGKHGKLRGLDRLFPRRIQNSAATEWLEEQLQQQRIDMAAKREAEHQAQLRKRSYWTFLDGYAFERATAEVLNKHQFNAFVTPGSGDGGIDVQVTRNGLKGVVQCKAHTACVGPHVVRDLYGVIHHTRASFGIIASLGGFTKGAVDFARDKPILFVDIDDLIAMQEGRDVLAEAFASSGKARA